MSSSVGSRLGRYRLMEEIGRGGMAVVYRAEDPQLGRDVAIKVMHAHLQHDDEAQHRFEREARSVAALRHPNIVEVYDFGVREEEEGKAAFLVAELIDGPTLRTFLKSRGRMLPEVAALVVAKLAAALDHAHQQGIVHRDIKPDNVMIATGGRLIVTDFGLARTVAGTTVTQTGATLGSPAYMSPEQARSQPVDQRSDVFSLGVLFYELATGQQPFGGDAPLAVLLRVVEGRYQPADKLNPQLGRELARVIHSMMQASPADRPSASSIHRDLGDYLGDFGLGNLDESLHSYFEQPGPFNRELSARIVEHSMAEAEAAMSSGARARALAFCDRVLAFDDEHQQALALLDSLATPRRWGWAMAGCALLLLVTLGGWWVWSVGRTQQNGRADGGQAVGSERTQGTQSAGQADRDAAASPPGADRGTTKPLAQDAARDAAPDAAPDATPRRRWSRRAPRPSPMPDQRVPRSLARDAGHSRDVLAPPGRLLIRLGPWCEAYVDGKRVGRSPLKRPLLLPPGPHRVRCIKGPGGAQANRRVHLRPGGVVEVSGSVVPPVLVKLALSDGDAVRVGGVVHRSDFRLPFRPHHVALLAKGKEVKAGWVTLPPKGPCTLVDRPRLACR